MYGTQLRLGCCWSWIFLFFFSVGASCILVDSAGWDRLAFLRRSAKCIVWLYVTPPGFTANHKETQKTSEEIKEKKIGYEAVKVWRITRLCDLCKWFISTISSESRKLSSSGSPSLRPCILKIWNESWNLYNQSFELNFREKSRYFTLWLETLAIPRSLLATFWRFLFGFFCITWECCPRSSLAAKNIVYFLRVFRASGCILHLCKRWGTGNVKKILCAV